MLSGRGVLRGQINEARGRQVQIPLGTGRGIAFVVFFAADADNIVGPGINGVVGRVSVQTQMDGAVGTDISLLCAGKLADEASADGNVRFQVPGHGQVVGIQTAVIQLYLQALQLQVVQMDVPHLQI